jgi:hypothetical protein
MKYKDRIKKISDSKKEPAKKANTESDKTNTQKGYNEKNPNEPEGAFTPDSKNT